MNSLVKVLSSNVFFLIKELQMENKNTEISNILEFWFGDVQKLKIKNVSSSMTLWFSGFPEIDNLINKKFRKLIDKAILGEFDHWLDSPDGALALIILLDQFPLNIFRNQARSFTLCHLALPYALSAINKRYDSFLTAERKSFIYLPLEHAEDIHLQKMSVELYAKEFETTNSTLKNFCKMNLEYAINHKRVIELFGRFPNRNLILGRPSTKEELDFLAKEGPGF